MAKPILTKIAQELAQKYYGIEAKVSQLPGELDYNFRLRGEDGGQYLLKIAHGGADLENLQMQNAIMGHLSEKALELQLPTLIPTLEGKFIQEIPWEAEENRFLRLLSWVPGRLWADQNPYTKELYRDLGAACAILDKSLIDFDHPGAHRFLKWDLAQTNWIADQLALFTNLEEKVLIQHFLQYFREEVQPIWADLRKSVIYNDANDYNILLSEGPAEVHVKGFIDFGDAIYTQTINGLAIAIAYVVMGQNNPLEWASHIVEGAHQQFPLEEKEVKVLYGLVAARLIISLTCAVMNQVEHPENGYLLVSQQGAWDLLKKWKTIPPDLAHYHFRAACGWNPHPSYEDFKVFVKENLNTFSPVLQIDWERTTMGPIDLSVGSLDLGNNASFMEIAPYEEKIREILNRQSLEMGYGGYGEIRPFYSTEAYKIEGNEGPEWRTIHLGMDFWIAAGTPVQAVTDGIVWSVVDNAGERDYGPTIILQHFFKDKVYYSLYGHLSRSSLTMVKEGEKVVSGQVIAYLGPAPENGNWPPHLHFQLVLDRLGQSGDFPGVAIFRDWPIWEQICPDPNWIFKLPLSPPTAITPTRILDIRSKHMGKGLSVSYSEPLKMVRGFGQFLYDHTARRFLDTVNNVPHVGHQHPRVVNAAQRQIGVLNTNTRYLHDNLVQYAEELTAMLPPELSVCHFVNSGSEANELALRMARVWSGQKDMLVQEVGYHGNTVACVEISSYKFDGKGGTGAADHIHVLPIPDGYRGKYRGAGPAIGAQYASEVKKIIEELAKKNRKPAGFISESILSCGGQIVLPEGYLKEAFQYVRQAGGLCILDEVQVGFGRVGEAFWAFELQGVVPDILTLGKPIGNGHPMGAVITTREVADAFANGMEYFNTFGGNPVSCAIGREVLQIIKEEQLQENALHTGQLLRKGLLELQEEFPIIGEVRGPGFFQGFELVKDRNTLEPAAVQASYLANRMRRHAILMSTDGPYYNVLKIKPPMVFNTQNVEFFITTLRKVLKEDYLQI